MVFVFYVSYACYFLVPAIGPRYTLAHAGPLPRGAISQAIDHTLDVLEKNKRDCFPSGHTMVLTAVLLEARAGRKRRSGPSCRSPSDSSSPRSTAATTTWRTCFAGFALAFVTVPLGNALYRRFGRPQPGSEAPGRGP